MEHKNSGMEGLYDGRPQPEPEAAPVVTKARRKRKKPTTLTVDEDMLKALDNLARSRGMSRAAVMILAFSEHLARSRS